MDMITNILVNVLPIILLAIIWCVNNILSIEQKYYKLYFAICALIGFSIWCAGHGYGNYVMAIFALILGIILCIYLIHFFCVCVKKPLFPVMVCSGVILYILYLIFVRLNYEGIIRFEFIEKMQNVNIFEILAPLTNNEWFKGIGIGIISAVMGGLILEKIKKK